MKNFINSLSEKILRQIYIIYEVKKDPRTPLLAKIIVIIALGYALSPFDLIPDFIPVLGYIDDLIILPLLILIATKLIPKNVWSECAKRAYTHKENLPKNWFTGLFIVLIWISIVILILFGFYYLLQ